MSGPTAPPAPGAREACPDCLASARRVLGAAHDFREECVKHGMSSAVRWITDETGAMFVYTRGEYANVLRDALARIESPDPVLHFVIPPEGEDAPPSPPPAARMSDTTRDLIAALRLAIKRERDGADPYDRHTTDAIVDAVNGRNDRVEAALDAAIRQQEAYLAEVVEWKAKAEHAESYAKDLDALIGMWRERCERTETERDRARKHDDAACRSVKTWTGLCHKAEAALAERTRERDAARTMLDDVHPPHPQPEFCSACVLLGRGAALGGGG